MNYGSNIDGGKIMCLVNLEKIDNYNFIAYATSCLNPLSNMEDASREIEKTINEPCNLLFDLLFSNGYSFNRFAKCWFDGHNIVSNTISLLEESEIDDKLKNQMKAYYQKIDKKLLSNSLLTKNEIGKLIRS